MCPGRTLLLWHGKVNLCLPCHCGGPGAGTKRKGTPCEGSAFASPCSYSIAPTTSTRTGVCRCKSLGPAMPQHGTIGVVTFSESLPELLLLLFSSPPPCRGKERRTSITGDPETLFAARARALSQRDVWSCGHPVSSCGLCTTGAAVDPHVPMAPQRPPEPRARIQWCVQCRHHHCPQQHLIWVEIGRKGGTTD